MSAKKIHIVATSVANLASVQALIRRLGYSSEPCDGSAILDVPILILPGVGNFGAATAALRGDSFSALQTRLQEGQATLGICLGLQLACEGSEESPEAQGLGVVARKISLLPTKSLPLPHFAWNDVSSNGHSVLDGAAYFAHSYALSAESAEGLSDWSFAWCEYGSKFVAAMEREKTLLCQFHPELSGDYGERLVKRWLDRISE